jgi:glycyl-tRNA synthetase beta chain
MPQLLIELFSEEIPARMQKRAEEDLARALGEKLKAHGLEPKAINTFSSPRRIGAVIDDLPAKAADVNEEKKGPRVGAPDQSVQGFLKSAGLASIDQAQIVADKKGDFYVARIERAGRETSAIAQEIIPEIIRAFPWPKSMRSQSSDLQWVRPLHNILCVFDGKPVRISVEGVGSEPVTWGHRFHAPEPIEVRDAASHVSKLRGAKVLIEREERKRIILEQAKKLCADRKLELVDDIGLLEEVAGLVEWPVTLLGDMDPSFLNLPGEVIRLSMRTHQKYFAVRDPKTGGLAPHFITVANVEAKDGGKAIAAGNARVLSARLSDAQFFWKVDTATPLFTDERREKLKKIVFHQKLGSVWDKVERVKALAVELCAVTGADPKLVQDAAYLCKMDLVTETVGEFPELQGQVGRQLYLASSSMEEAPLVRRSSESEGGRSGGGGARAGGEGQPLVGARRHQRASPPQSALRADSSSIEEERESVAAAIEDHYRPLGPNDRVPTDPVAVTLALADKLDTFAAFWAIEEKPTGSSDPYGLRRAGLGFIRIVTENGARIRLRAFGKHVVENIYKEGGGFGDPFYERQFAQENVGSFLAFLADRLKVQLRDQGKRHDLVDAVFALGDDDLVRIVARVEALDAFLKTEDGANLLAGYKRAANILAAEEKKGRGLSDADLAARLDAKLLKEPAEQALYEALEKALPAARAAVEKEEFAQAMKALSQLRAPVDAFFEKVLVNAEDAMLRRNRLLLLSRLREALSQVADFSKIEG